MELLVKFQDAQDELGVLREQVRLLCQDEVLKVASEASVDPSLEERLSNKLQLLANIILPNWVRPSHLRRRFFSFSPIPPRKNPAVSLGMWTITDKGPVRTVSCLDGKQLEQQQLRAQEDGLYQRMEVQAASHAQALETLSQSISHLQQIIAEKVRRV